MDPFFTSLTKRQTMMLLTSITFGGQEGLLAFDHLPEAEGALLRHKAQEILRIPKEKRIPLLVMEIKRLVGARRAFLPAADPEVIASLLKGERPGVIEVLLKALPSQLAEAIRGHLPVSPTKLPKGWEVLPEVLFVLRWKLEEALEKKGLGRPPFKFSDVLLLSPRELLTLCDWLGAKALGRAVAGLPEAERASFIGSLPPDLKPWLEASSKSADDRKLIPKDAAELLALHGTVAAEIVRSAGVRRLVRACLAQSPEFAARLLERHRGDFGALLGRWIRQERARAADRGDGGRAEVVGELERLCGKGLLAKPVRLPPPPKGQTAKRPALPPPGQGLKKPGSPSGNGGPPHGPGGRTR